jgi:hypothetical protein
MLLHALVLRNIEGTDTPPTCVVVADIEGCTKIEGFAAVDDVGEGLTVNISQHRMKETWADVSRRFDHS